MLSLFFILSKIESRVEGDNAQLPFEVKRKTESGLIRVDIFSFKVSSKNIYLGELVLVCSR